MEASEPLSSWEQDKDGVAIGRGGKAWTELKLHSQHRFSSKPHREVKERKKKKEQKKHVFWIYKTAPGPRSACGHLGKLRSLITMGVSPAHGAPGHPTFMSSPLLKGEGGLMKPDSSTLSCGVYFLSQAFPPKGR